MKSRSIATACAVLFLGGLAVPAISQARGSRSGAEKAVTKRIKVVYKRFMRENGGDVNVGCKAQGRKVPDSWKCSWMILPFPDDAFDWGYDGIEIPKGKVVVFAEKHGRYEITSLSGDDITN